MTLRVIANGTPYSQAKSISVRRSVRNFLGWFEIASSADENNRLPINVNDRVQIVTDDGDVLLTGYVERLRVQQNAGSHEIVVSGRDITADVVDSTLVTKQFNGPIAFLDLLTRVLSEQGLSSISVVNEAGALGQIKESELLSGEIGESAYDLIERYARRVQALITTNEDGAILVMRSGSVTAPASLVRVDRNPLNNILESTVEIDVSGRYSAYRCQSQLAPAGANFDATASETTAQSGDASDNKIRSGRFFEFEAETVMDADACADRVALEANVRRARSLNYSATVQGVPAAFKINRLVPVRDDFCGVNATLLISEIEHRFDLRGTVTVIGCTFSDAFSLEAEQSAASAARSETGGGFVLELDGAA